MKMYPSKQTFNTSHFIKKQLTLIIPSFLFKFLSFNPVLARLTIMLAHLTAMLAGLSVMFARHTAMLVSRACLFVSFTVMLARLP
jgi:hypothetical protein